MTLVVLVLSSSKKEVVMSRGVLLIGGAGPEPGRINRIVKPGDLLCAAGSGLDVALAAGIRPDGIVGDMDSISDKALLEGFPADVVNIHPGDKDETDAELGIVWLRERDCRTLIIIGGGEGRLDHTLALKALFGRNDPPTSWFTAREMIRSIEGLVEIHGEPGSAVSFFTIGCGPWNVRSIGLQWELGHLEWGIDTVSLSNRIKGNSAVVTVEKGRLLMIRPIEEVIKAETI